MKLFFVLALVLAGTAHAASTLTLCNRNPDRAIFGAVLKQVSGAGWQATGWYRVEAARCLDVSFGDYTGKAYLYAEDDRGETSWGDGAVTFCVDKTSAFSINNADTTACVAANLKTVHSDEVAIQAGANTWEAKPNFSQVSFCNQNAGFSVWAALAKKSADSWQSQGWYEIQASTCRLVTLGKYSGTFHFYGFNGGDLEWGSGPFQFCVNRTNAFSLPGADQPAQCTAAGLVMVKASEGTAAVGVTTVNFEAVALKTTLRLCNTTTTPITSAYAVAGAAAGQWRSTGWIALDPRGCRDVDLGSYTGKAYVYAERNGGDQYWGTGPVNMCVNKTQPFTLDDSTNQSKCSQDISQKMVPTFELDLKPGTLTFTFSP